MLFPERIADQYVALHRPVGGTPFATPEIWIARSDDVVHWGQHQFLYGGQHDWESGRVGAGTPPISTPVGWLEIYHGNRRPPAGGEVGAYFGAAMLLASDDPAHVIRAGHEPILTPDLDFEQEGFVANVVFPTGVVDDDDRLLIYYGASDKYTAVVELSFAEVLRA